MHILKALWNKDFIPAIFRVTLCSFKLWWKLLSLFNIFELSKVFILWCHLKGICIKKEKLGTSVIDREVWRKHVHSIVSTAVEQCRRVNCVLKCSEYADNTSIDFFLKTGLSQSPREVLFNILFLAIIAFFFLAISQLLPVGINLRSIKSMVIFFLTANMCIRVSFPS